LNDLGWSQRALERRLEESGRSAVTGAVPAAPG
jgi:hypothetical protein